MAFNLQTRVKTFASLDEAPLRSVCWDESTHVLLIPPLADYPILSHGAKTDLQRWV